MKEIRIIAQITIMGIIISTITLPIFYPDNWSINIIFVLSVIIWGLMFGLFYYLLNEVYKK